MYAVIQSGSKQYKVKEGKIYKFEKFNYYDINDKVEFNKILIGETITGEIKIGNPFINKAKVIGEIINHLRDKKIKIIKFRRRKHSMKKQGHRQYFTSIKILSVNF